MPRTYVNLLLHVVFSTRGHLQLLSAEVRSDLFLYMALLVKEVKGKPIVINGVADHVHMLILLPPDVCLSDAMRFIKANSSCWIKRRFGRPFAWQERHHQKIDFKAEFVALLDKHEAEYDERYLWD